MTLLTIVQDASNELNQPEPSSVINNNAKHVKQLLAYSNASGKRMLKRYDFEKLLTEFTHTTVATENQGTIETVFGSDFDRLEGQSLWNRDKTRQLRGPYTPQEWQREKGGLVSSFWEAFRLRGGDVFLTPAPPAGETIAGEYISNQWILDTDGTTTKAKYTADTDTSLIDEDLILLDIKWRWLRSHGFSYAEEKLEFERQFSAETGSDKSSRVISLNTITGLSENRDVDINRANTPDGGFGQ